MSDDEAQTVQPQQQQELFTQLVLRIHAANLPRQGILKALPDTYAVVTSVSGRASRSGPVSSNNNHESNENTQVMRTVEWGRTEVVYKNSHPQWTGSFTLNYEYGSECYFYIQVYRALGGNKGEESIGNAVCEIGDILGSKNHTKVKRLPKGGVIFCRMEPIQKANQDCIFRFRFAAHDLFVGRKGLASLSPFSSAPDTIVQISKRHPNASQLSWIAVYRSSPVQNSLNPTWDIGQIDLESVCNGDFDRPLRIAVLVHRKNAQDVTIGECETTLRMVLNTQRDTNLTNAQGDASNQGFQLQRNMNKAKTVGRLQIPLAQVIDIVQETEIDAPFDIHMSVDHLPPSTDDPYTIDIAALPSPMAAPASLQDYMESGWKFDFCVAIDFTSSNGDPRIPGTLHDQNPITLNDYEETMVSIGNAVAPYSDGQSSTVWGFGCKFGGAIRHVFQCGADQEVIDVDGILQAYKSVFESDLTMSGPTLFDQVIQAAAVRARKHQQAQQQRYCVLLVVTDGICQEIEETKRKLEVYSSVPLSVIFVGVGRADFRGMYELCHDEAPYTGSSLSLSVNRKNTSFVEFRQHQHDPTSLGRSALKALPSQFVEYMLQKDIKPSP